MYVSRLTFHTHPGQTGDVERELQELCAMVQRAGGANPRVLRGHLASPGAPDIVFEQEADDLAQLEQQIEAVASTSEFQRWSQEMSPRLVQSPKREIYVMVPPGGNGRAR
jgi:hypothetical protein